MSGMTLTPTPEQDLILTGFRAHQPMVIEALAGTGKTTTLRMLAQVPERTPRRGLYLAYNKLIATEAERSFPIKVSTAHSLAYRAIGTNYAHRLGGRRGAGSARLPASEVARMFKLTHERVGELTLTEAHQARLAQATVQRWCQSDAPTPQPRHMPADVPAEFGDPIEIWQLLEPTVTKVVADLANPAGKLHFTHDVYLKLWTLTQPQLPYDYILFDEAQDANPAIAKLVMAQDSAQLVCVGDRHQQLYGWRGAVDAMQWFPGERLPLTQSFRFGPQIAEVANHWLQQMGSELRVTGLAPHPSFVGPLGGAGDAVLCRTNGLVITNVMRCHRQSIPVAIAPGTPGAGSDIKHFAYDAGRLMRGEPPRSLELAAFTSWDQLVKYAEEEEGGKDLRTVVRLIQVHGVAELVRAIDRIVPADQAQVMISTGHKAKGMEWDSVEVADDFVVEPREGEQMVPKSEQMLAYVTVTRARRYLAPGPLGIQGE